MRRHQQAGGGAGHNQFEMCALKPFCPTCRPYFSLWIEEVVEKQEGAVAVDPPAAQAAPAAPAAQLAVQADVLQVRRETAQLVATSLGSRFEVNTQILLMSPESIHQGLLALQSQPHAAPAFMRGVGRYPAERLLGVRGLLHDGELLLPRGRPQHRQLH